MQEPPRCRRSESAQPALSRLISNLETDLGYALFRRGGGRVAATAEAELLRDEVQKALGSVDRACRRAQQLGNLEDGHLSVCAFPSLAATVMPKLLSRFHRKHPKIAVTLNAMHWSRLLDEVSLQRADFAISDLPARGSGVVADHLCAYHAVCVVRSDHRFAKQKLVSLKAIAADKLVLLGEEDEARETVASAFTAEQIDLSSRIEVSLCASACSWVSASGGCAIVDPFAAEEWFGKLVALPTDPCIQFDLWILRSETKPMTALASTFLESVRRYAATLPGA
jgi:DNA-binding transcriptional LysR family regulator